MNDYQVKRLVERTVQAAMAAREKLGTGFQNELVAQTMRCELASRGIESETQASLTVEYAGERLDGHRFDLLVENVVAVNLEHSPQNRPRDRSLWFEALRNAGIFHWLGIDLQQPRIIDGLQQTTVKATRSTSESMETVGYFDD